MAPTRSRAAVDELEQWRVVNTFVSELTRARGAKRVAQTAIRTGVANVAKRATSGQAGRPPTCPTWLCVPSGNLALVFFPDIEGRATLEQLNERFPGMVEALANHPGVGLLMVRSA